MAQQRHGDWRAPLETAASFVSRYWKVHDALEGERVVQTALCSLLYVGHGPYLVRHEQESAGGTVALRRIAVVFHGGNVACCEEI